MALLNVFAAGFDTHGPFGRNVHNKRHRLAANLTILDILLLLYRTIDKHFETLCTVRTLYNDCLLHIHCNLPFSSCFTELKGTWNALNCSGLIASGTFSLQQTG
jgi:hypothetical protein